MGVRKHRQAGTGKKRCRHGCHVALAVVNATTDAARRTRTRQQPGMYASVRELMESR
jgi:hypothetical protein